MVGPQQDRQDRIGQKYEERSMTEEQMNTTPEEVEETTGPVAESANDAVDPVPEEPKAIIAEPEADDEDLEDVGYDDEDLEDVGYDEEDIPPATEDLDEEELEEEEEELEAPGQFLDSLRGRRPRPRNRASQVRLEDINYRNIEVLSRFIDDRGRILSRRKTRISAKMQRRVTREIKRARHLALLPYTAEHVRLARKHR
jgi:small subunit ribosomal protein S18